MLRKNIILLGDNVADVNMANSNDLDGILKIGFLEENIEENKDIFVKNFDVVGVDNVGYDELSKKIKILMR